MYGITGQRILTKYRYYMICVALCVGIVTYYFKTTSIIPSMKIVCTIHGPLSNHGYTTFKEGVTYLQKSVTNPSHFIQSLQKNFSWIKNIYLKITPKAYHVIITTHTPIAYAHNQWLILDSGLIFESSVYKQSYNEKLPSITVIEDEIYNQKSMERLCNYIKNLPSDTLNFYALLWKNDHTIILQDRAQENFKIIISLEKSINNKKLSDCLYIKNLLHNNSSFTKKSDRWFADLRFSNHIIVAKEGSNYGSKLFS